MFVQKFRGSKNRRPWNICVIFIVTGQPITGGVFFGQNGQQLSGRHLFFSIKTGRHVNFCGNENFLTSFRVNETGNPNLISYLPVFQKYNIASFRHFHVLMSNKKPGLKLDDS